MKPVPGHYLFHVLTGPGAPYDVRASVKPEGLCDLGCGVMPYESAGDAFRKGENAITCTGAGTFEGLRGTEQYSGTCQYLGPI